MIKKMLLLLFCICGFVSFSQNAKILEKYRNKFAAFDSLNNLQSTKAKEILKSIEESADFKNNDTLKSTVYNSWITYFIHTDKNLTKVNENCKSCEQIALQSKIYKIASKCLHNKAVAYHFENKIKQAIEIEKKSLEYARLGNSNLDMYISIVAIAKRLTYLGRYKESNDILITNLSKIEDKETKGVALLTIASNYNDLGEKIPLKKYYLGAISNLSKTKYKRLLVGAFLEYSNYLLDQKNYKETLVYADSILYNSQTDKSIATAKYLKSRAYYGLKQFSNSLININDALLLDTKDYDAYNLLDDYKVRGKIYLDLGKTDLAIADFKKSKSLFKEAQDDILEAEVLKYNILANLKDANKELYSDFEKYITLTDSLYNQENINNLSEFETKYRTKEKEAKIKTQQLQIEKEKTNRNLAISGILFVVLLGSGGWFIYRNKQKQKEKQLEYEINNLNNDINEMELQTLNQQLDPHEITNYIQSVSGQILRKDEKLYNQLINLWDITNIVLNHKEITSYVNTEIENLEKYLTFQQEIVHPKFEFNITNKLKDDKIKIPRLLLRNLAGNAIKHGLKGIEGKIDIDIFEQDNIVNIHVQDNGKGFEQNKLGKGIGTSTYENIFTKLNLKNKEKATIEINNLEKGVLVKVCIPKNYNFLN